MNAPDQPDLLALAEALGHTFHEQAHLIEALTHRSYVHENTRGPARDNERLEFLGDAILGFVIASMLHEAYPLADEGELTQRRAALVSGSALGQLATSLSLGKYLRLGKGEERTQGREKPRLLASAFEACMAAVYLDGGIDAAIRVGRKLFDEAVRTTTPGGNDWKTRLQEAVQAAGREVVAYQVTQVVGPDHDRTYHIAVSVGSDVIGNGSGRSKSDAEQDAARAALQSMAATK